MKMKKTMTITEYLIENGFEVEERRHTTALGYEWSNWVVKTESEEYLVQECGNHGLNGCYTACKLGSVGALVTRAKIATVVKKIKEDC